MGQTLKLIGAWLVSGLALACALGGCASTGTTTPAPAPTTSPQSAPTQTPSAPAAQAHTDTSPVGTAAALPPNTLRVPHLGFWLDSSADTKPFSTFITVYVTCDDPYPTLDATDNRRIVFSVSLFNYGPTARSRNGYSLRPDYAACWSTISTFIVNHLDRALYIWFLDEPDAVAYGDMGPVYTPNLYNADIETACELIAASFPLVPRGLNYSGVNNALVVPPCLSVVGLEVYGATWATDIVNLEARTSASIVPLLRAFCDCEAPATVDADRKSVV